MRAMIVLFLAANLLLTAGCPTGTDPDDTSGTTPGEVTDGGPDQSPPETTEPDPPQVTPSDPGQSDAEAGQAGSQLLLTNDPVSPLIARRVTPDGASVNYFAERSDDGGFTRLTMIEVASADGQTSRLWLDRFERLQLLEGADGRSFAFNYGNEETGLLTVRDAGVTLETTSFAIPAGHKDREVESKPARAGKSHSRSQSVERPGVTVIEIEIDDCDGQPRDDLEQVWVELTGSPGKLTFPARWSNGRYVVEIPRNATADERLAAMCRDIVNHDFFTLFCCGEGVAAILGPLCVGYPVSCPAFVAGLLYELICIGPCGASTPVPEFTCDQLESLGDALNFAEYFAAWSGLAGLEVTAMARLNTCDGSEVVASTPQRTANFIDPGYLGTQGRVSFRLEACDRTQDGYFFAAIIGDSGFSGTPERAQQIVANPLSGTPGLQDTAPPFTGTWSESRQCAQYRGSDLYEVDLSESGDGTLILTRESGQFVFNSSLTRSATRIAPGPNGEPAQTDLPFCSSRFDREASFSVAPTVYLRRGETRTLRFEVRSNMAPGTEINLSIALLPWMVTGAEPVEICFSSDPNDPCTGPSMFEVPISFDYLKSTYEAWARQLGGGTDMDLSELDDLFDQVQLGLPGLGTPDFTIAPGRPSSLEEEDCLPLQIWLGGAARHDRAGSAFLFVDYRIE